MSTGRHLTELPPPERRDALEIIVVNHLKKTLSMSDDEDLPLDQSFFDIGLTSLMLTDIRTHLQDLLGVDIDATVLFNQPTVDRLVADLAGRLEPSREEASRAG
jgi:acyl carrier protein